MNRRNFIKMGSIAAFCGILGSYYYIDSENKKEQHKSEYLQHLDIHVVEHCNLSCKYCFHYSCIAEPEFLDPITFEKDMDKLSELTNRKIDRIFLLGGEPLLHPQLNRIIKIARKYFPETYLCVFTNGLLLHTMPQEFWDTLKQNYVELIATVYNVGMTKNDYKKDANKNGVKINLIGRGNIIQTFNRMDMHRNGDINLIERYENCYHKIECAYFEKGKIFACPFIPNIRHYNKKFNLNYKISKDDYIDIYEAKSIQDIFEFFKKPPPFCRYCGYFTKYAKWEASPTHDISEWTYEFDKDT